MGAFAALHLTGNSTPSLASVLGTAITGLTAAAASRHGEASFTLDASAGKMTAATAMRAEVAAQASLETEDISGTSGDGVGVLGIAIAKNGTIVAGTKALIDQEAVDKLKSLSIPPYPIDLAKGDYLTIVAISNDASGNDVTVREMQFTARRTD